MFRLPRRVLASRRDIAGACTSTPRSSRDGVLAALTPLTPGLNTRPPRLGYLGLLLTAHEEWSSRRDHRSTRIPTRRRPWIPESGGLQSPERYSIPNRAT